jgi:lipopolysaccharide transport system ATP-binding protein
MSETMISVENVGKLYTLKHKIAGERYSTFRDVLTRVALAPFRALSGKGRNTAGSNAETAEDFWAIKDVSFQVNQGDVVGIIGANGAGKSTLLKILSRITEPTIGRIRRGTHWTREHFFKWSSSWDEPHRDQGQV